MVHFVQLLKNKTIILPGRKIPRGITVEYDIKNPFSQVGQKKFGFILIMDQDKISVLVPSTQHDEKWGNYDVMIMLIS